MNAAKYVVVKQRKRSPYTVVGAEEFEVRDDARTDAKAKNANAVNYKFIVVPLKVGKIKRSLPDPVPLPGIFNRVES